MYGSTACWINGICGPDGTCERDGSDRKCRCSDDAVNLLGDPKLPCFKKCLLLSSFSLLLFILILFSYETTNKLTIIKRVLNIIMILYVHYILIQL